VSGLVWSLSFLITPEPVEGEFVTVGITAEETSTFYHVDQSKPNPLITTDPWSRSSVPLWSHPAKKQKLEVVGKVSLSLSSLFGASNTSEIDPHALLKRQINEGDCRGFLLSLERARDQDSDLVRAISVADRIQLLSHLSDEINLESLSLSIGRTAALIKELLFSLLDCPEMSDITMDLVLEVLLSKQCCHEALLFFVENWLQTNPFAELLAHPSFSSFSPGEPVTLPSSLNLTEEVSLAKKDQWSLFFLICWCVRVLAFGPSKPTVSSKSDLVLLAVHLVRSIIQFGVVVVSSSRTSPFLQREIDPFPFGLEILRSVGLLLPFVVNHDQSFVPCSFELLLAFFRCVTHAAPQSKEMQTRFIESTCRLITRAEMPPSTNRAQMQSQIHPRRTTTQAPYTLSVSSNEKRNANPFSLWTPSRSGTLEKDLLHFFRALKACFPIRSPQSKHAIADFLMVVVNAFVTRLKTLPSEVAIPPMIRKRVSLEQSHLRQPVNVRFKSVVSTTLQGIIERGEALPHLNPFDIVILFLGDRVEELTSLLDLSAELNRQLCETSVPVQKSVPPPSSKPTSHEDRMNRAPVDGRVSVRTGRRLVGSTITRRLLGRVSQKSKQCDETLSTEATEPDGATALEILGPFRLVMGSVEHFWSPGADHPSFLAFYSKMCLAVNHNLIATASSVGYHDTSGDKHLAATLEREGSRILAGYETLRVFLFVIRASHQFFSSSLAHQSSQRHVDCLSTDLPRVSEIALTCASLVTSDPFLNQEDPAFRTSESFLRLQQKSLRVWHQVWLDLITTATCLCDSFVIFLSSNDHSSGDLLETHFLNLCGILERHCRIEGIPEGRSTLFRESLRESGPSAVSHLIAAIEQSCRGSSSRPPNLRRSSVSPQNHDFYRHLSAGLVANDGPESLNSLDKPNYPRLLRLCLFRCCLEIASAVGPSTTQSLRFLEPLPFPTALWQISHHIVDAIDQWISRVLPPGVTPLSPIPSDPKWRGLQFGEVAEILNCLKLALQDAMFQSASPTPGISPLRELTTRVHHTLHRWGTYASTFADLSGNDSLVRPNRHSSPDLCHQWSLALRSATIFSFLDRVVVRSSSSEALLTFFGTAGCGSDRQLSPPHVGTRSEMVCQLLLELAFGRGQRFQRIVSLTLNKAQTLPLPLEAVLSYCHSKGIEWENHHQQLREVLKGLLAAGYWELADRITKFYLAEYRESKAAQAETHRKEKVVSKHAPPLSKSISSPHSMTYSGGVQHRLSTLAEELDRMSDKLQDRLLHDGDSRPRPVFFVVRFLVSPWKGASDQQKVDGRFAEFFAMTEFSFVEVESPSLGGDQAPAGKHSHSLSAVGISSDELWVLVKVDPLAFADNLTTSALALDNIERSGGALGTVARLIRQVSSHSSILIRMTLFSWKVPFRSIWWSLPLPYILSIGTQLILRSTRRPLRRRIPPPRR
jgi:hypothetical protein